MSTSGRAVSTWAPLRVGIFRALWLAVVVSNIGSWMQTVGAQWLLVNQREHGLGRERSLLYKMTIGLFLLPPSFDYVWWPLWGLSMIRPENNAKGSNLHAPDSEEHMRTYVFGQPFMAYLVPDRNRPYWFNAC